MRAGSTVRVWRCKGNQFRPEYTIKTTSRSEGVIELLQCVILSFHCLDRSHGMVRHIWRWTPHFKALSCENGCNCLPKRTEYKSSFHSPQVWKFLLFFGPLILFCRATIRRKLFQHDGATPHTANSTKAWLRANRVHQLNNGKWPAMSPDLNPVEHVWPLVLRNLEYQSFANLDALWSALQFAFNCVTVQEIQNLYASMHRRMAAVIVNKGGHTKY